MACNQVMLTLNYSKPTGVLQGFRNLLEHSPCHVAWITFSLSHTVHRNEEFRIKHSL